MKKVIIIFALITGLFSMSQYVITDNHPNEDEYIEIVEFSNRGGRPTKYVQTTPRFSETHFSKPDIYRQTSTIARVGYVLNDNGVWQPTFILHDIDYYSSTEGAIFKKNEPAEPYVTENTIYKSYTYPDYDLSPEAYQDLALYYFNKGTVFINGQEY